MILRAYAKINLGLQIIGKRPDGYHDIETVFHLINLSDEIELSPGENGVRLHSDSRDIPTDDNNLCIKAAYLLQQITGTQQNVDIVLRKRIPIGAGLGGGSSDAAATLVGLTKMWGLDISSSELRALSLTLGADIPFFIDGGTAHATGKGERLEQMELEIPYWIITVTPSVHVSTSWAYGKIELSSHVKHANLRSLVGENISDPRTLVNKLRNDFEQVVFRYYPEVMRAKEQLVRGGADFALMSGSGSSVFGLFSDKTYVKELAESLSSAYHVSLTEPFFKPEPIILSE